MKQKLHGIFFEDGENLINDIRHFFLLPWIS